MALDRQHCVRDFPKMISNINIKRIILTVLIKTNIIELFHV